VGTIYVHVHSFVETSLTRLDIGGNGGCATMLLPEG
jgi:hypothetical protein